MFEGGVFLCCGGWGNVGFFELGDGVFDVGEFRGVNLDVGLVVWVDLGCRVGVDGFEYKFCNIVGGFGFGFVLL